jgi:hypothetical protein
MTKEEKILREYFTFKDVNGSETIECLPLTLVDMLIEYKQAFNNESETIKRIKWRIKNRWWIRIVQRIHLKFLILRDKI